MRDAGTSATAPETAPPVAPRAVLIGPMAAGKTHVGRSLARMWGVRFVDLDHEIERRSGRSIPEIFAAEGEEGFRAEEARVLADLLCTHDGVLALGGGAPLTPESARRLAGHAVVLLTVDDRTARHRLRGGRGRPLLAGQDPMAAWRRITEARMPAYRDLAAHTIDGSGLGPVAVARRIARLLAEISTVPMTAGPVHGADGPVPGSPGTAPLTTIPTDREVPS